jgi:hypothetical protein
MLQFLNYFFFAFHTFWTLFNIVGWIWYPTRKLHLITMLITAGSWFILGLFYGIGYCACTDWHWQVREKLGYNDRSNSYIHFLIFKITGVDLDPELVDTVTMIVFILCFILTVFLNVRDWRVKKVTGRGRHLTP